MKSFLIRAEDKNIWERRTPIVPANLKEILSKTKANVFVQRSEKRFFPSQEYESVGAQLCDDIVPGEIIFGIKEIPEQKILDDKIYLFFSHTIKGQSGNMPMLKKIISGGSTLIEYEKITDTQDQRLIYFGRYAGDAGAIDIMWLMGEYWHHKGITTPFSQCKQATNYSSVKDAQDHFREIGELIKKQGITKAISPLIIGILGYGNVSLGAQQIFDCLPIERVDPKDLKSFVEENRGNSNTIYLTVFKEKHLVEHNLKKTFNLQDYYSQPENYSSIFDQYLSHISVLVNAVYWDKRYPRFVTWKSLKRLFKANPTPKLSGISDITCDINGSVECNVKATDPGMPAYLCDPFTRSITDGHKGEGVVVLAVDNLPAEIPHDSSVFFSKQLKQFVPNLLSANYDKSLQDSGLAPEIQKAVVVYKGELTTPYKYLNQFLL